MLLRMYLGAALGFCFATHAIGQEPIDFRKIIQDLSEKCEKTGDYLFEGDMEVTGQRGSQPTSLLVKAKVKCAAAESGKYFFRVEKLSGDGYTLVSDGQKSWAYMPKLKQYTEQESAALVSNREDVDQWSAGDDVASNVEKDLTETFARQVMPMLAGLAKNAAIADAKGNEDVRLHGKKQKWPVVRVMLREDKQAGRNRVDLAIDPSTLNVGRMLWINSRPSENQRSLTQMTLEFSTFLVGEKLPDDTFVFVPPKKAKLVEAFPIPGLSGSSLLNRPAPDFDIRTITGRHVRLSELRGHVVLLSFWASWCAPCRRELPELAKIYDAYNEKGLLIFGVNDEGTRPARDYSTLANLPFDTLDDSFGNISRRYGVRAIPCVFLIDREGKVVRFFSGVHQEATFRGALKNVGL